MGAPHDGQPADRAPGGEPRRDLLTRLAALLCGGLATLPPVAAGVWTFLDPLRRKGAAAAFLPVAEFTAVPDDGLPRRFPVVSDRTDAWTGFAREPIGAVYLRREQGSDRVQALSATCPHAGCFVEVDPQEKCFRCPCHNSRFAIDGGIVPPSPSPRAMDELECRVAPGGEIEVEWRNFYTGIAEKKARP
ncbi:MAG: Rieske (2Fe-2S) protein [Planctomycetia bacterium]|nr:Rieske (2Fe-2S) protein [Planctomycetia bacterium]